MRATIQAPSPTGRRRPLTRRARGRVRRLLVWGTFQFSGLYSGDRHSRRNLGAFLLAVTFAECGLRTLAVDVDPQGTLTRQLGVETRGRPTIREVLFGGWPAGDALVPARPRLDVVGADLRLRRAMHGLAHDLALLDCPPSLGKLTVNALVAAGWFLATLEPSAYSLEGLAMLLPTVAQTREFYNPALRFLGPALVMAEPRTTVTRLIREQLADA